MAILQRERIVRRFPIWTFPVRGFHVRWAKFGSFAFGEDGMAVATSATQAHAPRPSARCHVPYVVNLLSFVQVWKSSD
eukprot:scaffold3348_cov113-Isochrysis_galbana.AAC.1